MKRNLRPRPAVTAAPIVVSDLTSFDIVGLTASQYRALLRANPETPRTVVGQRMLVKVTDLLALLDRLASTEAAPVAVADDEPQSEAEVLARLGFRRTA